MSSDVDDDVFVRHIKRTLGDDVIVEHITSVSSLQSCEAVALALGDPGSACDEISFHDMDVESVPRKKSTREIVGECCVGVFCTTTVGLALLLSVVIVVVGAIKVVIASLYWTHCTANRQLPIFLIVSGLAPAIFYVSCRTRQKVKGKVPEKQRIQGRWQFSVWRCTLDTQRSWQAGLAGVLCVFLLAWLLYGTVLTIRTMHHVKNRPVHCDLVPLRHRNVTSDDMSSSSLLSSAFTNSSAPVAINERGNQTRASSVKTDSLLLSALLSSSLSSTSSSYSSPDSSSPLPLPDKLISSEENDIHIHSAGVLESSATSVPYHNYHHNHSQLVRHEDLDVLMDISNPTTECEECDDRFVMWCFALVLFDWAYMVTLLVNLLVLGSVPCCCYIGMEV